MGDMEKNQDRYGVAQKEGTTFEEHHSTQSQDYEAQIESLKKQEEDGTFILPTPEEEAKVIRKLDWRLLPLVFLLYSLAVLDRSNLGNAKLAGMEKDIDLSGNRYTLLGTVFYITYILSQWTTIGWKQFPPHRWAACVVAFWGVLASVQAATTSWGGLMACRALLGVAEAMFGPGVILYLSYFYSREKVGFRHGVFISGAAMANVYGSVLAYGIAQINGALAPWRILFLIEGLPTIAFAVVAWFLIPDSLSKAPFLTMREKQVALYMVSKDQVVDVGEERGVRWTELFEAFKDFKSFAMALIYFGCNVSFASLPLFLPTIISELGTFDDVTSEGLSAPPYALCVLVIWVLSWTSDRVKVRGPFVVGTALVAAVGFIINATTETTAPRYASTFLSVIIFATVALSLAWNSNMHASESKRGGAYVIMYTIGQCGPVLGSNVFPTSEKPLYRKGMWISAAMCLMVAGVATGLSCYLAWENKQMDKKEAADGETHEAMLRRRRNIW